jgi:hypothetical protein
MAQGRRFVTDARRPFKSSSRRARIPELPCAGFFVLDRANFFSSVWAGEVMCDGGLSRAAPWRKFTFVAPPAVHPNKVSR